MSSGTLGIKPELLGFSSLIVDSSLDRLVLRCLVFDLVLLSCWGLSAFPAAVVAVIDTVVVVPDGGFGFTRRLIPVSVHLSP